MAFLGAARAKAAWDLGRALFGPERPGPDGILAPEQLDQLMAVMAGCVQHVRPVLHGAERIPAGGALLCGNHAIMGVDSVALYPLVWQATRRLMRGLGDRALFPVPYFGEAIGRVGAVEGRSDTAASLLRAGELCLVYPGGALESFKTPDRRYQLHWRDHFGFARVAMQAQVPIVPILSAGPDHAYRFLFHERLVTRRFFGDGTSRYDFPISLGLGLLPLPIPFAFQVGEPVHPPIGAHLADDPEAVAAFQARVWRQAQAELDVHVQAWHTAQLRSRVGQILLRIAGPGAYGAA